MPRQTASRIFDFLRAWPLALVALILIAIVLIADIARLDNLIWGVCKVAVFGYAGYWIDRWIFPYARPHDWWWDSPPDEPDEHAESSLTSEELSALQGHPVITPIPQIRRAVIMAACIITAVLIP